ncbi:hypothetical protein [Haloarcula japonica]|uniref:Uncharacterized protein n=1 Tax=Haloarcula japonica (strain ATCC 49778 / DSM 6131 / JCM 7785 / NBRC 101032 / NCIMB 13157 / TR-1) TaxID=1227453 RepID=M0L597_HALJT|nr:hypothetical protein [Haloarcula japonica]EMA27155.1 hypothetical protein C444_20586 [Haloarcula japonica DSM 6131]
MKRRTVLAGVVPFLQGGRWLDQLLLVNQGEIVQKRFVGIAGGETTEIAVTDDDGTTVSSEHEGQLGQSPAKISPEVATSLRETYDSIRFHVTVNHHNGSLKVFSRTGSVEYRISRALYSGIAVGDHISFQTSLLNSDTIISLSCLADQKESLQRRCRVGVEDPTAER